MGRAQDAGAKGRADATPPGAPTRERRLDRRTLLRRGGAAVAGVTGWAALGTSAATTASAAAGQSLVLGRTNDAEAASTAVSAGSANATLSIANTATGSALNLTSRADADPTGYRATSDLGDLTFAGGQLAVTHAAGDVGTVFTTSNATMTVPLPAPVRVLDTRSAAGRSAVLTPAGLDSAGRVLGGQTVSVDLGRLVTYGWAAFCNVTITGPVSSGYLSVWAAGNPRPTSSTLNFTAGATLANFALAGLGSYDASHSDVVNIYANTTTHVILDVTAFVVSWMGDVVALGSTGSTAAAMSRRAQQAARHRATR